MQKLNRMRASFLLQWEYSCLPHPGESLRGNGRQASFLLQWQYSCLTHPGDSLRGNRRQASFLLQWQYSCLLHPGDSLQGNRRQASFLLQWWHSCLPHPGDSLRGICLWWHEFFMTSVSTAIMRTVEENYEGVVIGGRRVTNFEICRWHNITCQYTRKNQEIFQRFGTRKCTLQHVYQCTEVQNNAGQQTRQYLSASGPW